MTELAKLRAENARLVKMLNWLARNIEKGLTCPPLAQLPDCEGEERVSCVLCWELAARQAVEGEGKQC